MEDETETLRLSGVSSAALERLEDAAEQRHMTLDALLRITITAAANGLAKATTAPSRSETIGAAHLDFIRAHGADSPSPLRWSPAVQSAAGRMLHRFVHTLRWDTPVAAITSLHLRAFLGGPRVTEPVATKHLELLTSFFDWCIEQGYITESPVPGVWVREDGAHHPTIGLRAWIEAGRPITFNNEPPSPRIVRLDDYRERKV